MTPEKVNTIVLLLMLGTCVAIFADKDKKNRIIQMGLAIMAFGAQAYYASIAENMLVEILFTALWGWLVYRIWEKTYGIKKAN